MKCKQLVFPGLSTKECGKEAICLIKGKALCELHAQLIEQRGRVPIDKEGATTQ